MKIKGKKLSYALGGLLLTSSFNANAQDAVIGDVPLSMDLTLDKAIEIALAENPTIKVADKEIELKKVADTEAWQALLPTASVTASHQYTILAATMKLNDMEFKMGKDGTSTAAVIGTLNLPLFAPAVYQNMKLTKEDINLALEKSRSSKLDLVNQVTKAYYAALLAQDSYQVMLNSYKTSKDNFDIVNQKYQVGSVSEYDKISAEVQMRAMNSSVVSAQTGLTLAELQLKVLMGITTDISLNIADSLKHYEDQLVIPYVSESEATLEANSSLRQIDLNMKLLERTRKILKTNFMPTIGLQISGQYQSLYNSNWNWFQYAWSPSSSLSLALTIPLYDASNFTKLKTNKIQMAQLQDTRLDAERQLKMAVESYKQNMASTIAQVHSNAEAVRQAEKAVIISSKRYEVGRGTILELNQSETAETQAELTYVQSIYDYLTNRADLDYTLGREKYLR